MSTTFDTMQHAVVALRELCREQDTQATQAADILHFLGKIIDDLHEYSHRHDNAPNRECGRYEECLRIAIECEDDDERWLRFSRVSVRGRSTSCPSDYGCV